MNFFIWTDASFSPTISTVKRLLPAGIKVTNAFSTCSPQTQVEVISIANARELAASNKLGPWTALYNSSLSQISFSY
jgi:hypothetical protein